MSNLFEHSVVLLVDHQSQSLLPVNQRGLSRTQKNRRRLNAEYSNAELLLPTGEILPIIDFEIGRSTDLGFPKPFAWLSFTGERYLTIAFGPPRQESVDQSRATVLEYLSRDSHRDEWIRGGETWEQLLQRVRDANSHRQIFEALHLVAPEDGLDVFS